MPTGKEFSIEEKTFIFRMTEFVESEKNDRQILFTSIGVRVIALLGISYSSSVHCLKKKVEEFRQQTAMEATPSPSSDEYRKCHKPYLSPSFGSTSSDHRKAKETWSAKELASRAATEVPKPIIPRKKGNVGQRQIALSESAEDAILHHFHLILARININTYFIWKRIFRSLNGATTTFKESWEVNLLSIQIFQFGLR